MNGKKKLASPKVKMTVSLVLETEEAKDRPDSLKPAMYMTYEDMPLEELALMCRTKGDGCPFGGFGCPFAHKEWLKMHEGERCTANPCAYATAKDWEDAFGIYERERHRKDEEFWENA